MCGDNRKGEKKMKKMIGLWSVCLLAAGVAQADVVSIDDALAGRAGSANGNGITGTQADLDRILEAGVYDNGFHAHPVFVFQMTGVTVPANITNANFSVTMTAKLGTPSFNADAYVIRKDASSTILTNDYETTAQSLMSGFSTSSSVVGDVAGLDTAGQSTLGTWLQNNWADGEYVFIGLKTDPLTPPTPDDKEFYRYSEGAWNSAWSEGKTDAQLTLDVIPEPATLGLIAAFGGGLLFVRRRFMM